MTEQPDLFGELDVIQERTRIMHQPATCPCCGITEPSGYLLDSNHGVDPVTGTICGTRPGTHPIYGVQCTAQYLVTNHIISATRWPEKWGPENTARAIARGRELGLDVDAIIAAERGENV